MFDSLVRKLSLANLGLSKRDLSKFKFELMRFMFEKKLDKRGLGQSKVI